MTGLPIASSRESGREVGKLARRYKAQVAWTVVLYTIAAAAGLGAPWLLGQLIDTVDSGSISTVNTIALAVAGFVLVQALFSGISHYVSSRLGETIMARLREQFVRRSLALPLTTVERAGAGDLMTRSSRDITQLGHVLRRAAPETFVCLLTLVLTLVALTLASPLLSLVAIVTTVPVLWGPARWYLRRSRAAYLAENASHSAIAEGLAATVEGARTVEALRIQRERITKGDGLIRKSYATERATLHLRTVLFPTLDFGVTLPVAAVLVVGGLMYAGDMLSLGLVTAAVLYVNQAGEPMFTLLAMLDELQVGNASLGRVIGVGPVKDETTQKRPASASQGSGVSLRDVHYAYTRGRDVLHGVNLDIAPGERLAMVGPSGAGKSTLGRLVAGIDAPGSGTLTVGGHDLTKLPLEERRREVLLVTQEHHVFLGTLRDNLALANTAATDTEITAALAAVDADDWLLQLPDGLETVVGSAEITVDPARAQQIALARLVLADPDVLVLDEATSLLDPRTARHLERHLAAVLSGRTVVAIAHRLHTAHDADRIAVVEDGRIAELGSHHDLVATGGRYADLWRSWQG